MSGISLTAPMRSTLLSLQNIARQQDIVQNRLATGLKVSSAIDNPSAYYTAASLSNRAADLSALLDAMSQGVQTIKTASEAITSATKFLEQAKATANQALETSEPIVAKVSTEEELLAAVESGERGFIVLRADISLTQTLELKDGQKLVGDNYFSSTPGANRTISFNFDGFTDDGIRLGDNGLVANLNINYETNSNDSSQGYGAIHAFGSQNAEIKNVNISLSNDTGLPYLHGIYTNNSALAKLSGNYEVVYILDPNLNEEATTAMVSKFQTLVEQNGTLAEVNEWGKRRLAYPINDMTEGYYVLMTFSSKPEFPRELDRILRITDGVMRSLIVSKDE